MGYESWLERDRLVLLDGAEQVGDPIAVLPVLFHLLWRRELHTDLDRPLYPEVLVIAEVVGS